MAGIFAGAVGCGEQSVSTLGASTGAFGQAPSVPGGDLDTDVEAATSALSEGLAEGGLDRDALGVIAASDDARLGWLISDALRFVPPGKDSDDLVDAFVALTAIDVRRSGEFSESAWLSVTNHLIAWDLPAFPGYREQKAKLFLAIEPAWEPFFADTDSAIDWRLVSWGGVLIDDRPLGDPEPCAGGCIPALDDPELTSAPQGDWFDDEGIVFGIEVGGEAVAFPKNVMEVHEMVNISIGGRRIGIPYCTLCGSAQAYFLDGEEVGSGELVLRTSGLLSRSNKVMYELNTGSVIDTFSGEALSGPLEEQGVELEQVSVTVSSWGAWKRSHPETRIVAEDGGIDREYPEDPLSGRDDSGPIFPVGDVDPRLPVQEEVVGVTSPSGTPIAFPVAAAREVLADGGRVTSGGVVVRPDGDGLAAFFQGAELPSHQAFWFAWSQFNPATEVWTPGPDG